MLIAKPNTTDEYISGFPKGTQTILRQVRTTIKKLLPEAKEEISYGIPAFKLEGSPVIYFAGYTKHISVYPAPRGKEEFKQELAEYKGGKGTVQFPLDKPIPLGLITRIVKFRLKETKDMLAAKNKNKG